MTEIERHRLYRLADRLRDYDMGDRDHLTVPMLLATMRHIARDIDDLVASNIARQIAAMRSGRE
jgi:hypothetical protein